MDLTADAPLPGRPQPRSFAALRIDWTLKDVLFGMLWFVALFVVAPIPLVLPFVLAGGEESSVFYAASLVIGAASEAGLVVVAAAYTFRKYGGGWERLGFGRIRWSTLGWAVAAVVVAFALSAAYSAAIELFDIDALRSKCDDQLPKDIINTPWLLALSGVIVVGFAPICEETFFRGFIFPGLARPWGVAAGVVVSALVFSVAHVSPSLHKTFMPILFIGLVFALAYWKSGNILSTVLAHLVFNSISFAALATQDCT